MTSNSYPIISILAGQSAKVNSCMVPWFLAYTISRNTLTNCLSKRVLASRNNSQDCRGFWTGGTNATNPLRSLIVFARLVSCL